MDKVTEKLSTTKMYNKISLSEPSERQSIVTEFYNRTTLTESKYFGIRRAIVAAECEDNSDGLIITQLPAAIAPDREGKK